MVLFFTSTAVDPPVTIYMGIDKVENEDLIKYGFEEDVWFHVDKLSSAHVYLRLPKSIPSWEAIPEALLQDCAQLVKANSIEGNKKRNQTIIYTPWSNIKKVGDMAIGAVSFHNDRRVKRVYVKDRENAIVNRLNKTKREIDVDHEMVRQEREREQGREKKAKATELRNAELAEARARQADNKARDYSTLFSEEALEEARLEKERKARRKAREREERLAAGGGASAQGEEGEEGEEEGDQDGGMESDDSFM